MYNNYTRASDNAGNMRNELELHNAKETIAT